MCYMRAYYLPSIQHPTGIYYFRLIIKGEREHNRFYLKVLAI